MPAIGGEPAAGRVAKSGTNAERTRRQACRLDTRCERKQRAAEMLACNGRLQSWLELTRLARQNIAAAPKPQAQDIVFQ